jgi:hypothetical protein
VKGDLERGTDFLDDGASLCSGYLGHPFAKLVVCVSMITRFYHFP